MLTDQGITVAEAVYSAIDSGDLVLLVCELLLDYVRENIKQDAYFIEASG